MTGFDRERQTREQPRVTATSGEFVGFEHGVGNGVWGAGLETRDAAVTEAATGRDTLQL